MLLLEWWSVVLELEVDVIAELPEQTDTLLASSQAPNYIRAHGNLWK